MNALSDAVESAPAGVSATRQAIPFRPEGEDLASQAVDVLGALAILLAACLVAAWYARKRGWLDRWVAGTRLPRALVHKSMQVERVLRVSPRTTLYSVSDQGRSYLLVESSVNARVQIVDAVDEPDA